jgi:hypothetical protein
MASGVISEGIRGFKSHPSHQITGSNRSFLGILSSVFPPEIIEEYRKHRIDEHLSGQFTDKEIWERYGMSESAFWMRYLPTVICPIFSQHPRNH